MRDRIIVAACVLGVLGVIGGIVVFNDSGDDAGSSQAKKPPGERVESGEGVFIDGPFFRLIFEQDRPDASQPVTGPRPVAPAVARSSVSSAGGTGVPPAARPAMVAAPPAPACNASLLGSVIGLLGGLLGRGC